ncbi:substrate-binding domain-containing protein [Enterococcus crotali]|uniref:substrate-binding domain-containing protein n=1 Tax=Enterococcus crotali TaxID=1453587 RepID=UPI0004715643
MKITIKKIAEEAGVSVTTVSNVINNKAHRVSDTKKELIQSIIKKYNYSPNMNARALVQSSSRLIGLLYFSDKPKLDFSDPFVTEVLEGIERIAKENGFFILVHSVNSMEDIEEVQKNWKFEGFIAVGFTQQLFEQADKIIQSPIVFLDTHLEEQMYTKIKNYPNRYFINTNDFQAGFDATSYLLSRGIEKIAFLSYGFDENQTSVIQQRYLGYKAALNQQNIDIEEQLIYTDEEQSDMLEAIDAYQGVIVTADFLALTFIHFLKQHQAYSEEKLSIIGFDDIAYAALNDPPLSTVRLDQISKGEKAMQLLVDISIKEEDASKIDQLNELQGKLVIRKTTR